MIDAMMRPHRREGRGCAEHRRFVMRRFAMLLSVVVVLLSSAVMLSRPPAAAQEATPTGMVAMAEHPAVGTWEMSGEAGDFTFPFLAIFHADGTYLERYPWGAVFVGVWKPTGERTAEGTVIAYEYIDDRLTRGEGRFTVEVDETGNTIDTDGTFINRFVDDGSIDLAIEGPSPGTRLEVQPVVPLSELVPGGTPVIPAELTAEATPTP
jgi:YD repeat-containing protein